MLLWGLLWVVGLGFPSERGRGGGYRGAAAATTTTTRRTTTMTMTTMTTTTMTTPPPFAVTNHNDTYLFDAHGEPDDDAVHGALEKRLVHPLLHLMSTHLDRLGLQVRRRLWVGVDDHVVLVVEPARIVVLLVPLLLLLLLLLLVRLVLVLVLLLVVPCVRSIRLLLPARLLPLLGRQLLQRRLLGVLRPPLGPRLPALRDVLGLLLPLLLFPQELRPLSLLLQPLLLERDLHLALELRHVGQALPVIGLQVVQVVVVRQRQLREHQRWSLAGGCGWGERR